MVLVIEFNPLTLLEGDYFRMLACPFKGLQGQQGKKTLQQRNIGRKDGIHIHIYQFK